MNAGLKKAILLGVGAFHMTKEKIQDVVQELQNEGALDADEGKQLFAEMLGKSEERAKEFRDTVATEVQRVLNEMIESVDEEDHDHDHDHDHHHHEHVHGEDCHDCCCGKECCTEGHKCGEGECDCGGKMCDKDGCVCKDHHKDEEMMGGE